jgi:hypothetical protein
MYELKCDSENVQILGTNRKKIFFSFDEMKKDAHFL